ncbi:hypothetical protein OGAPHI_006400 [Ogataea philodendri]|uniref:Phosphatidylserine decarboxylase proenzyme 1, mitochondrial n=1 Tax=Ogataea philodendri TaxID=1378263 RepID=A0A9P8NY15_9ASCO|nr:uncharacterized protein OGAPHI_006400 [Ogataea philodendri]KAH3661552.1 hypothetical protein OGAPHI_006400 [Ogataea philodendri]
MFLNSRTSIQACTSLNKPLTRASTNASINQQRAYYYAFPKIPRPKRNILYYKATSISIVASFKQPLIKSIGNRYGLPVRKNFIASTKKLFGKRQYGTKAVSSKKSRRVPFRSWFTLTTISVIFFGVVARYSFDEDVGEGGDEDKKAHDIGSWPLYIYSRLPLNSLSRLWGQVNNIELPIWMREPGFRFYSALFGVNLEEMQDPDFKHYKNLGEFFSRSIKPEARPIDNTALLCSPCDGKVLKFGAVGDDGGIEQVKGITYKVGSLLGTRNSPRLAAPQHEIQLDKSARESEFIDLHGGEKTLNYQHEGDQSLSHPSTSDILTVTKSLLGPSSHKHGSELYYAVIYLAPGDYHRFHSPVEWVATLRRHFVGELYSVAPYFQRTLQNLFILNERVAVLGYWKYGFFSMTPVGATNVGSIKLNFDTHLATNEAYEHELYSKSELREAIREKDSVQEKKKPKKNTCYEATYAKASSLLHGIPLFRGEEMGTFKLGSTIVLVFEAPSDFRFTLKENQTVRMGQCIGKLEE